MKFFPWIIMVSVCFLGFGSYAHRAAGWTRVEKFRHNNDSFILAPVSYDYPWDVKRDSNGKFYAYDHRQLTAKDTAGFPRNAHVLMNRKGDYPAQDMNNIIRVNLLPDDTLKITVWLGDGEWFADYVFRVKGKYFKSGCEPDSPEQATSYIKDSLHYHTVTQSLELNKKKYKVGDSIRGFMDCHFVMSRTPSRTSQIVYGDKPWTANIELVGPFKAVVLCDTCQHW